MQTNDMPEPLFSRFRALGLCLFKKELYADVRLRWRGLGFTYLLLLNVLIVVPVVVFGVLLLDRTLYDVRDEAHIAITEASEAVISQIPEITWKNGHMKTKAKQPYVITVNTDGEDEPFIIINRKGTIDELKDSKAVALLTKDAVHVKKDGKIESRFWSEFEFKRDVVMLNEDIARELVAQAKDWMQHNRYVVYSMMVGGLGLCLLVFLQIYRVVQALIYGLVGMAVASLFKADLRYDAAVRVASVALTPAIVIDVVLLMVGAGGISMVMSMVITTGYMVFAIRPAAAGQGA